MRSRGFGLLPIPLAIGVRLLFALRHQRWRWFPAQASVGALGVGMLLALIMRFQPDKL